MSQTSDLPSLTPYILRAFYEWCVDHDFTPQIVVVVEREDVDVQVPRAYVQDGKITLDISPEATGGLEIENDSIHFDARFSGEVEHIWIPIGNVIAIFAPENGAGIPFELDRSRKSELNPSTGPGFTRVE